MFYLYDAQAAASRRINAEFDVLARKLDPLKEQSDELGRRIEDFRARSTVLKAPVLTPEG